MKIVAFVVVFFLSQQSFAGAMSCAIENNFDDFIEMPEEIGFEDLGAQLNVALPDGLQMSCDVLSRNNSFATARCGNVDDGLLVMVDEELNLLILDFQYLAPLARYSCQ